MAKLPFDPTQLNAKEKSIYSAMVAERKKHGAPFGGPYAALMNHPELCQKIEALGGYLKFQGHLARDVYQFVVLAIAQSTRAAFEWVDHVNHAKAAGVPEEVITSLCSKGVVNPQFPQPYQLASEILNFSLHWQNIPEPLQQQAISQFTMYGYIEIVVLSGFYQMFSAVNQGFNVPLDPGAHSPW